MVDATSHLLWYLPSSLVGEPPIFSWRHGYLDQSPHSARCGQRIKFQPLKCKQCVWFPGSGCKERGSFFLFPDSWNVDLMPGAQAATLVHKEACKGSRRSFNSNLALFTFEFLHRVKEISILLKPQLFWVFHYVAWKPSVNNLFVFPASLAARAQPVARLYLRKALWSRQPQQGACIPRVGIASSVQW